MFYTLFTLPQKISSWYIPKNDWIFIYMPNQHFL